LKEEKEKEEEKEEVKTASLCSVQGPNFAVNCIKDCRKLKYIRFPKK